MNNGSRPINTLLELLNLFHGYDISISIVKLTSLCERMIMLKLINLLSGYLSQINTHPFKVLLVKRQENNVNQW